MNGSHGKPWATRRYSKSVVAKKDQVMNKRPMRRCAGFKVLLAVVMMAICNWRPVDGSAGSSSSIDIAPLSSSEKAVDVSFKYMGIPPSQEAAKQTRVAKSLLGDHNVDSSLEIFAGTRIWDVSCEASVPLHAPAGQTHASTTDFKFTIFLDSSLGSLLGVVGRPVSLGDVGPNGPRISALIAYQPIGQQIKGFPRTMPRVPLLEALASCNGLAPKAQKISASYVLLSDGNASPIARWIIDLQMPVDVVSDSTAAARDLPITDWRFIIDESSGSVVYYMGTTNSKRLKFR